MRIGFVYKIAKTPIDYRSSFLSLIKEGIKNSDLNLYEEFYESDKRDTKPFCFGVFFQNPRFGSDVIEIKGNKTFIYLP